MGFTETLGLGRFIDLSLSFGTAASQLCRRLGCSTMCPQFATVARVTNLPQLPTIPSPVESRVRVLPLSGGSYKIAPGFPPSSFLRFTPFLSRNIRPGMVSLATMIHDTHLMLGETIDAV